MERYFIEVKDSVVAQTTFKEKILVSFIWLGLTLLGIVAIFVAILTFFINPYISARQDKLLKIIRAKTVFQTILPGQFQQTAQSQKVFYIKAYKRYICS